jgi:hypothetical protein
MKRRVVHALLVGIRVVVEDVKERVEVELGVEVLVVQTGKGFLWVVVGRLEGLFGDVVARPNRMEEMIRCQLS